MQTSEPQDYPTSAPKITIIGIWNPGSSTPLYLPNFFASVGANPRIEVLLIKFDKYNFGQAACEQERAPHIKNVREVCVPLEEYYRLHSDYLCREWGCTEEQAKTVAEVVKKRFEDGDRVRASFVYALHPFLLVPPGQLVLPPVPRRGLQAVHG